MRGIKTIAPLLESAAKVCGIELVVWHKGKTLLKTSFLDTAISHTDVAIAIAEFEADTNPYHMTRQPNGDALYGVPLNKTQNNTWLLALMPIQQQDITKEDVMSLLKSLIDILKNQQADKTEIDDLARALDHSYEELALYRRLQKSFRTGTASPADMSGLFARLREILNVDLVFSQFSASPDLNSTIFDPQLQEFLDIDTFAADLVKAIMTVKTADDSNFFLLNKSLNDPAFSSLCKRPFRLMASQAVYNDHTYGWLGVISFNFYDAFKRNHLNMLQATASQAALVGVNNDLLQGLEGLTTQVNTFKSELANNPGKLETGGDSGGLHPGDFIEKAFGNLSKSIEATKALMLRSAQMATIGQMAAVFAHEIKQPVCALDGFIQIAQLKDYDLDQAQDFKKMARAVGRISRIIKRFESFSRPHESILRPVSLNQIAREVYQLVRPQLNINQIEGSIHRDADLPMIMGDSQGLQQAVLNLVSNAIQAMESDNGHQSELQLITYCEQQQACLEVSDNGQGISENLLAKVSEPYFTTKAPDKGTGLGLSVVTDIVEQHNGCLEINSAPGKGSRFTIKIPAHTGQHENLDWRRP